jgi:predicted nucleotidyltransferase
MTYHDAIHHLQANRPTLHNLGVASLSLFGSVVRNEATDASDLDFLVSFCKLVGYFEFLDVKDYLESVLGIDVDLATNDMLRPEMLERISAEAVSVF